MLLYTSLALLACNLGGKPVTDAVGDDTGDTATPGTDVTIKDIRTGVVPLDQSVTVEHVIVTSPHTQGDEGFFVQDAGGGPNSGIYVWSYDGVGDVFAEPGDEVRITGTPTDYYGWTEFSVESVEITGSGTVPAPEDLGDGSGVTDWDAYESVLVSLSAQSVDSVNEYGTGLLSSGISLDNGFYNFDLLCGASYPTLTGVMFYSYEAYSINPRDDADLSDAELPETIDATCADVQAGVCGSVRLSDVVVTSNDWTDDNGSYFFVQDEGGGEGSGLLVFLPALEYDVSVGDTVTVTGTTNEFYGLTELKVTDLANVETTGTSVPVVSVVTEVPADAADWESWESCLITIEDVTATSDEDFGAVTTDKNILIDDVLYPSFDAANGDHWNEVTGLVYYSYEKWSLLPRSASDLD
jgi:predicted extracellular nuclease